MHTTAIFRNENQLHHTKETGLDLKRFHHFHENHTSWLTWELCVHTHTHTHVWFLKFINITFKLFLSFIVFLSNYYYYYDCCRCCSNFYKSFSFHNDSLNENNHHLWNEWLLLNYYRMLIGWLRENRNLIFYYIFLIWYSYFFFDFRLNSRLCSLLGNEKLPSIMRKNLKKKKMIMRISENYISLHKKWIVLCVCVGFFFCKQFDGFSFCWHFYSSLWTNILAHRVKQQQRTHYNKNTARKM